MKPDKHGIWCINFNAGLGENTSDGDTMRWILSHKENAYDWSFMLNRDGTFTVLAGKLIYNVYPKYDPHGNTPYSKLPINYKDMKLIVEC